jgi:hypothetical protein
MYRWYRIQYPRENFEISSIIEGNPFTSKSNFGFAFIKDEFGNLKYRFLKRSKLTITVLDENGEPAYQDVLTVDVIDFSIFYIDSFVFLRVENPGRSIRALLNTLEKLIGLGFRCKAVTFEKIKPTEIFSNLDDTKLVGLKVTGILSGQNLKANLELTSNEGFVTDNIKILEGMRYSISSAVIDVLYEGLRGRVSLASTGLVKVTGKLTPKIIHIIEKSLPKSL